MRTIHIVKILLTPILVLSVFAVIPATAKAEREHSKSEDKYDQKQHKGNTSQKRDHSGNREKVPYKDVKRSDNRGSPDSRIRRAPEQRSQDRYNPAWRGTPQHDTRGSYDYRRYDSHRPVARNTYRKYSRVVIPSRRYHNNYIYVQPFRHSYPRYRRIYHGDRFWGWLAFTAVTLQILDHLDHEHQLAHERALYRASISPIGETIIWSKGHIAGSVTPVWEGPSHAGQYCREYRHEVTIDDRTEIAYGTACRNPDDTWEIVQ